MWLLWVLGFAAVFFLLARMVNGLSGKHSGGIQKMLPVVEDEDLEKDALLSATHADATPYFENLLTLDEQTPQLLKVSWKLDQQFYLDKLAHYHQENVDTGKATIRLSYTGKRRIYEDYPIRLAEKSLEIIIDAPGETITGELGFFTEAHDFISILTSNDVTIAQ